MSHRQFQRQSSISEYLVRDMFNDDRLTQAITECLQNNNPYPNLNPTQTGIYWNDTYNNYHISFHPGGSMTPAGATHIKYDVRDNYGRLIRTVNFPIHVYDIDQRNQPFRNQNVMSFGQDIEIDLSRLHQIPREQHNDVIYLLGKIGDCLFIVLTDYLQSRDAMMWGRGGKKIRRTRKKEVKKKKKTLKK